MIRNKLGRINFIRKIGMISLPMIVGIRAWIILLIVVNIVNVILFTSPWMVALFHFLYKGIDYILRTIRKGSSNHNINGHPCRINEIIVKGMDNKPLFKSMNGA